MTRQQHPRLAPWLAAALAGLLALCVYLASPVSQATADPRYTVLLAETLLHKGTFRLDESFRPPLDPTRYASIDESGLPYQVLRSGEAIYLAYPVGSAVLSVPLVAVLNAAGLRSHTEDWLYDPAGDAKVQRLLAALLCAAAVAVMARTAGRLLPFGWALGLALAFAFGTMLWSSASRALWNDCWGMLLVALALDRMVAWRGQPPGWKGAAWLASLLAWSYIVRPTYLIPCLAVTAWVGARHRSILVPFAATAALWAVLFLVWSRLTFGTLLPPYYQQGNRLVLEGFAARLAGILFSPSRGLLVFMPGLLWLGAVMVLGRGRLADRALAVLAGVVVALTLLLNAAWPVWWGGYSYGPRLLTGLLPWLFLLSILAVEGWRRGNHAGESSNRLLLAAGAALLVPGILLHARGALDRRTWEWNAAPVSVNEDPARLWSWPHSQPLAGLVPPPFPPGGLFPMGSGAADPFLGRGWSHAEGTHRWNDGRRAVLHWSGGDFTEARTLTVRGFPLDRVGTPSHQRIRATWNGVPLGEVEFHGEATFPLPPMPGRFRHRLEFGFPDATSPAATDPGGDPRLLAAGVTEIAIR